MEIVTNQKGGRTLLFEGYVYTVDRQTTDKTLWRCSQKGQCKARIHTSGGQVVKRVNEHSHAPSGTNAEIRRATHQIREEALSTRDRPMRLVDGAIGNLSEDAAANLPSMDALRQRVHHARHVRGQVPANPESLEDQHLDTY